MFWVNQVSPSAVKKPVITVISSVPGNCTVTFAQAIAVDGPNNAAEADPPRGRPP